VTGICRCGVAYNGHLEIVHVHCSSSKLTELLSDTLNSMLYCDGMTMSSMTVR